MIAMNAPTGQTPPLDWPDYDISFVDAYKRGFKKYATFSGRASRSEFWWVQLFIWLLNLIPVIVINVGAAGSMNASGEFILNGVAVVGIALAVIIALLLIIPSLALTWRRLHDANLSGAFFLFVLIPGVGSLILFILVLMPSNPAGVRFDKL